MLTLRPVVVFFVFVENNNNRKKKKKTGQGSRRVPAAGRPVLLPRAPTALVRAWRVRRVPFRVPARGFQGE